MEFWALKKTEWLNKLEKNAIGVQPDSVLSKCFTSKLNVMKDLFNLLEAAFDFLTSLCLFLAAVIGLVLNKKDKES